MERYEVATNRLYRHKSGSFYTAMLVVPKEDISQVLYSNGKCDYIRPVESFTEILTSGSGERATNYYRFEPTNEPARVERKKLRYGGCTVISIAQEGQIDEEELYAVYQFEGVTGVMEIDRFCDRFRLNKNKLMREWEEVCNTAQLVMNKRGTDE